MYMYDKIIYYPWRKRNSSDHQSVRHSKTYISSVTKVTSCSLLRCGMKERESQGLGLRLHASKLAINDK